MIKLSSSELYIMHIIWDKKQVTSFDILEKVEKNKKISSNTVRTLLSRMVKKNAITITNKIGKTYTYKSLIDENEYLTFELRKFIDIFYKGNGEEFILDIIKNNNIPINEIIKIFETICN